MSKPNSGVSDPSQFQLREAARVAILPFMVARVCVAAAYAIGRFVATRTGSDEQFFHLDQGLVTWDGAFYRGIAENGYIEPASLLAQDNPLRFFPLYPIVAKVLSVFTLGNESIALVLVANLCAFASLVLLYLVVTDYLTSESTATASVWAMALFPAGAAFVMAYSESMMLMFGLAAVLFARRNLLYWTWLCLFAAALTRPVGVLFAVIVAMELLEWERPEAALARTISTTDTSRGVGRFSARTWLHDVRANRTLSDLSAIGLTVISAPIGLVSYLTWVGFEHHYWRAPLEIQRELRGAFVFPIVRVFDAAMDVLGGNFNDGTNLVFALFGMVSVVIMYRRVPFGWFVFSALSLVIALSSENLDSIGRYLMVTFPIVVSIALVVNRKPTWSWTSNGVLGIGLVGFSVVTWLGIVIP